MTGRRVAEFFRIKRRKSVSRFRRLCYNDFIYRYVTFYLWREQHEKKSDRNRGRS